MQAASIADLDDFDLEAMKALIRAQHEQLSSRANEIAHLKLLLDKLQRMLFGAKSEKLVRQVAQLELQLEELETSRGEEEVSMPLRFDAPAEHEPKQSSRRTLPEQLPRLIHLQPTVLLAPTVVALLGDLGLFTSQRRRLAARHCHFDLTQQVHYLLRCVPPPSCHVQLLETKSLS